MRRSKGLKDKMDEELRQIIKERMAEKKRRELEIKTASETLRRLKMGYYQFWDAVREAKETLGARQAKGCPALKRERRQNKYSSSEGIVCKAKRYKYHCWSKDDMYREHCFACHLTPEQARTAMIYDRILVGRREDGQ